MVNKKNVVPGTVIKVAKEMPDGSAPGPSFRGKLGLHERLTLLTCKMSQGPLNLVKVRRHKTDETFSVYYAWVTGFCRLAND